MRTRSSVWDHSHSAKRGAKNYQAVERYFFFGISRGSICRSTEPASVRSVLLPPLSSLPAVYLTCGEVFGGGLSFCLDMGAVLHRGIENALLQPIRSDRVYRLLLGFLWHDGR